MNRRTAYAFLLFALLGCKTTERAVPDGPKRDTLDSETAIVGIDFSRDSRYFAHICQDGSIHLTDVLRDESAGQVEGEGTRNTITLAVDRRFATVQPDGVQVFRSPSRREALLPLPEQPLLFLRFNQQGDLLAGVSDDGSVSVWDMSAGGVLQETFRAVEVDEHTKLLPGPGFRMICQTGGETIRLRGLESKATETTLIFPHDPAVDATMSDDGRMLAAVDRDGDVEVRTLPQGELRVSISELPAVPRSLTLAPDGSVLAIDLGDGGVELWDTLAGERLDRFESSVSRESGVRFSPNGYQLAWVEEQRHRVRLWLPVGDVVAWTTDGAEVKPAAAAVGSDLATLVRFQRAMTPFQAGSDLLAADDTAAAIEQFATVRALLPNFPGLDDANRRARGRHAAKLRSAALDLELEELRDAGSYEEAAARIDQFLRVHAGFGEFGYEAQARRLATLLAHLAAAESHRDAERLIDAVVEFELGVAIEARLTDQHPEDGQLRRDLTEELTTRNAAAFAAGDYEQLVGVSADLRRLRLLEPIELLQLGIAFETIGDRAQAESAYNEVPADAPQYARAHQNLARIARAAGELETAKNELEAASQVDLTDVSIWTDLAEVNRERGALDDAIDAWKSVARFDRRDATPFERIGEIELERGQLTGARDAFRQAVDRAGDARPELLVQLARVHDGAKELDQLLAAYVELLAMIRSGVTLPAHGERSEHVVLGWIRDLGYTHDRDRWVPQSQFLAEQGWVRHGDRWFRPGELQLAQVAERFSAEDVTELRTMPDERYVTEAERKRLVQGMNRREVVKAWGYFTDQNVMENSRGDVVYEQLSFEGGRQVYLRNGHVCFWSE